LIPENIGPSHPKSEWDYLPVATDGRKVGDIATPELTARLGALGIEGFSHTSGRQANIEAYAAAHQKVYDAAGKAAVAQWLARGAA
jgi:hypothetical protein